jgi:hypothetical protein
MKKKTKYVLEDVKGIPYGRQKSMATWSEKTAKLVTSKLRPLVGKKVVLYGGGGWDYNIGKLKSVKTKPAFYYPVENKPLPKGVKIIENPEWKGNYGYYSKKDFIVEADLKLNTPIGGRTEVTPHIGSWKIGKLKKLKKVV